MKPTNTIAVRLVLFLLSIKASFSQNQTELLELMSNVQRYFPIKSRSNFNFRFYTGNFPSAGGHCPETRLFVSNNSSYTTTNHIGWAGFLWKIRDGSQEQISVDENNYYSNTLMISGGSDAICLTAVKYNTGGTTSGILLGNIASTCGKTWSWAGQSVYVNGSRSDLKCLWLEGAGGSNQKAIGRLVWKMLDGFENGIEYLKSRHDDICSPPIFGTDPKSFHFAVYNNGKAEDLSIKKKFYETIDSYVQSPGIAKKTCTEEGYKGPHIHDAELNEICNVNDFTLHTNVTRDTMVQFLTDSGIEIKKKVIRDRMDIPDYATLYVPQEYDTFKV
ncbi:hypothetical protein BB559_000199 [Furculomyces boomerangus]|uniref:Choloylglycine hydrolase/NAAA C-terminal domain-containing protein n=1 Tax=Furculomyces boomerangus TaxID=61424 RepID=A0A2T9Z638_9FUNG|nr:hypothetical protein BB559_000199 [Furculomyces boomerangus]